MKMLTFARRCAKEILRDPLNLAFGLGFPLVLLILLSSLQANIPVELFEINTLTPGITIFGLSFVTLFSATLVAKDRESALLQRLYTTPLTGVDFILGYMLPILPIAIGQTVICYLFAVPLGLTVSVNLVYAVIGVIPMAVFNIALGLMFGSFLGVKQVGGICGQLFQQNGYSVRDVQTAMGFENPQAIYKWLAGRSLPSIDNLIVLSVILHVSIEEILVVDGDFCFWVETFLPLFCIS